MTQLSRLSIISLFCIILQGCHSVKKTLGIERDAPDEFAVTPSNQPLEMPPDFFLPIPDPGCPRPQEVREINAKKEKLLGSTSQEKGVLSPGQKALLEKAGVEPGQENIRRKMDEESHIERAKGKPILEQLGIKKSKPKEEIVNPYDESLELQKKGIPQNRTPIPS